MTKLPLLPIVVTLLIAGCAGSSSGPEGTTIRSDATAPPDGVDTGTIVGMVFDSDEKPVTGALVGLDSGPEARTTNSTDLGSFQFDLVPVGAHKVFAQKLGYASAGASIEVKKDESTQVRVVLDALCAACADIPTEATLYGVETMGGWFQISYADAAKALPTGFSAKPHVLLDSNGQTAEYSFYIAKYKNGTVEGRELAAGFWGFEVLSVDPAAPHQSGSTVDFVPLRNYASDPELRALFNQWRFPTLPANGTYSYLGATAATEASATITAEKSTYQVTVADLASQETLTSGALSVRYFGLEEKTILSYIDLSVTGVQYSLVGAARLDQATGTAYTPTAPVGEGYVQWGAEAKQLIRYSPAKSAPADL